MNATQDSTGYKCLPAQKWIIGVVNDHLQEETFSNDQMPTLLISHKKLTTTMFYLLLHHHQYLQHGSPEV
jgi:hypothetical protein